MVKPSRKQKRPPPSLLGDVAAPKLKQTKVDKKINATFEIFSAAEYSNSLTRTLEGLHEKVRTMPKWTVKAVKEI